MNPLEIWKDIEGFEGKYQVSNMGEVKSFCDNKPKILKPKYNHGYAHVSLSMGKKVYMKKIHRLVAEAFIPNPENKPHVNHIYGIKSFNAAHGLEWVTMKENMAHAIKMGLFVIPKALKGKDNNRSKAVKQLTIDGNEIAEYESINIASIETGIYHSGISRVLNGTRNSAGGYKWKFSN